MEKSDMLYMLINRFTDGNKAKFAALLCIKPQTLSAWIKRNTFDPELIHKMLPNVSTDWLLSSGNGDMLIDDHAPAVTHGDHSPAVTGSGNVVTTGGGDSATEAALRERVRLLEELVAEKERTIGLLMRGGK